MQHKNSQNDDVLWRLARATCDLAKAASDQKIRAERMTEAFEYAAKALAANPNNFACQKVPSYGYFTFWHHEWFCSILTDNFYVLFQLQFLA